MYGVNYTEEIGSTDPFDECQGNTRAWTLRGASGERGNSEKPPEFRDELSVPLASNAGAGRTDMSTTVPQPADPRAQVSTTSPAEFGNPYKKPIPCFLVWNASTQCLYEELSFFSAPLYPWGSPFSGAGPDHSLCLSVSRKAREFGPWCHISAQVEIKNTFFSQQILRNHDYFLKELLFICLVFLSKLRIHATT